MELILREATCYFLDTRKEVHNLSRLPHVLCEIVHSFIFSERGFETAIMMAALDVTIEDRDDLTSHLLAEPNPYVANWCARVIALHRKVSGDYKTTNHIILRTALAWVRDAVCNRPSCWYDSTCFCNWPLRWTPRSQRLLCR